MVNLFKNHKELTIYAPTNGRICELSEVQDAMFAQKLLGDGCAIIPSDGLICAPCDGVLSMVANTHHAFGITGKQGIELLVHVGLDSVQLQGKGFRLLAKVNEKVKAHDPILLVDMDFMKKEAIDLTIPIVIMNANHFTLEHSIQQGEVTTSSMIMKLTKK